MAEFTINADTRIQILDKLAHLARARKHQYAAFVRDEGVLCVWADTVESIVKTTETLEQSLIDYIWHQENAFKKGGFTAHLDAHTQQEKMLSDLATSAEAASMDEKAVDALSVLDSEDLARSRARQHWKERPVMLYDAFSTGMTAIITIALLALGWRESYETDSRLDLLISAPKCHRYAREGIFAGWQGDKDVSDNHRSCHCLRRDGRHWNRSFVTSYADPWLPCAPGKKFTVQVLVGSFVSEILQDDRTCYGIC